MPSWEYRIEPLDAGGAHNYPETSLKNLNQVGNEGWEAVAWLSNPNRPGSGWVLLKKPIRS
jgi:hypothetical protein